jgi:AraC-like DNA-binding protein
MSATAMSQFKVQLLLDTGTVRVRDVVCSGECRHRSDEECTSATHLVFAYRGIFVRHVGRNDAVAEANQLLFFNEAETYQVSHPIEGGDACLDLVIEEGHLRELAPQEQLRAGGVLAFRRQRRRIDPRAQALVALLRHSLSRNVAETLEAETLALTLVRRSLGERTSHVAGASPGRQKLVDRAKLVLASDLSRRWTLADIAAEVGVSPVYLTQMFQQVEAMPLYRYHLRLRLARGLDLLGRYDNLTTLGMDLGFSSHSHFSSAFRQVYGRTPAEFQRAIRSR